MTPLEVVAADLRDRVEDLEFGPPTAHVYNPLRYAWEPHSEYLRRFGAGSKRVVFLGMNPGPFGMAQTGVPFGDVVTVAEWLQIRVELQSPRDLHPKRPLLGLDCPRVEVSGQRLWGWIRSRWQDPARFFEDHLVLNYCPLVFLEESARNRTPDRLPASERSALFALCDASLRRAVEATTPQVVVGIGRFASQRAAAALEGFDIRVGEVLHPSPASPTANRGWSAQAERQLAEIGVPLP